MIDVKGKVALVVGACSDEGAAISLRLAKSGAKLAVVDANAAGVEALGKKLGETGAQTEGMALDCTNPSEVKNAIDTFVKKLGAVEILVNCMDHVNGKPISECSYEDMEASLRGNVTPMFLFSALVIPMMREKKYGKIVNLSSLDYLGFPGESNYCAAKSSIFGFTRSLALELAKDRITVNCVARGDIKTSTMELSDEDEGKAAGRLPVKRLGSPEDVAYAACFFADDTSKYVTGQTLFVCGGKSLYSSMSV